MTRLEQENQALSCAAARGRATTSRRLRAALDEGETGRSEALTRLLHEMKLVATSTRQCCCWVRPAWARSCLRACCTATRRVGTSRWCT